MGRRFVARIPVRFGDIDQAGIAYYPTLLDHCHAAFEEFWARGVGLRYPTVIGAHKLGFPTVRLEADFRRPLRFGDVLAIEVTIAALGRASVTFRYRARAGRALAFEVRATTVCVDMRTFRPRPLPAAYRRRLGRHLRVTRRRA